MFAKWDEENDCLIAGPQSLKVDHSWLSVVDSVGAFNKKTHTKKLRLADGQIEYYLAEKSFDWAAQNRGIRNNYLAQTDWTQTLDAPLSETDQLKYRTYRQALRDLTTHENWPELNDEDWPTLED
jgi:hypothetical protein